MIDRTRLRGVLGDPRGSVLTNERLKPFCEQAEKQAESAELYIAAALFAISTGNFAGADRFLQLAGMPTVEVIETNAIERDNAGFRVGNTPQRQKRADREVEASGDRDQDVISPQRTPGEKVLR